MKMNFAVVCCLKFAHTTVSHWHIKPQTPMAHLFMTQICKKWFLDFVCVN